MKKILLSLLLIGGSLQVDAAPRTEAEAMNVALQFVHAEPAFRAFRSSALTLSQQSHADMRRVRSPFASSAPAYYIYNVEDGNGFVVVSADDRFRPILGYSTTGNIQADETLPDGLQYWLGFLTEEMERAMDNGYQPSASRVASSANYTRSVQPLLTTKWNQTSPYNNMIPTFATGCVATALAQVMKYWSFPAQGMGSHTNASMSVYSANFGTTTYDWAHMKDEYGGKRDTKEEVDAVATLMYHLGVATDMRWTANNSATPPLYAGYALTTYFGYNKNLRFESRDHVSLGAWKAMLLDQLYTGHPVCYSGMTSATSNEGHFFVCDGYDATNGQFHFNWGWGGSFDGYFAITALEPGGEGEAGALSGSYNYCQYMFVDVQPTTTGQYVARFDCETVAPKSVNCQKDAVVMRTTVLTHNALSFAGSIGLAVYNADGSLCQYIASDKSFPGRLNLGTSYSDAEDFSVDLSPLADGTYTVCLATQHNDYPGTPYPVRAMYGRSTYYTLTVTGNQVSFAEQKGDVYITDSAAPTVSNAKETNTVYENCLACFAVTVKNDGTTTFNDEVGVCIKLGSRDSKRQYITVPCTLLPGEEKTVELCGIIVREPGDYTLVTCCGDDGEYYELDSSISLTVKDEASSVRPSRLTDDEHVIFSLQGTRLPETNSLKKGVYIKNGRTFIKQ